MSGSSWKRLKAQNFSDIILDFGSILDLSPALLTLFHSIEENLNASRKLEKRVSFTPCKFRLWEPLVQFLKVIFQMSLLLLQLILLQPG